MANPYEMMIRDLGRYHASDGAAERLGNELMVSGYNVTTDFVRRQVGAPWVYSERMAEFYEATDAFVFELLVWHYQPARIAWRRNIISRIRERFPEGASILSLGDGIGMDSLAIATALPDYRVTSFEFDGPSARFATRRAEDHRANVQFVHDLKALPSGGFDVVVCLDVLEHVPDPCSVIADMARYLRPTGRVFASEAFGVVEPLRPTHLLCNLRYSGRTIELFADQGLRFEEIFCGRIFEFSRGASTSVNPARLITTAKTSVRHRLAGLLDMQRHRRQYGGRPFDLRSWMEENVDSNQG